MPISSVHVFWPRVRVVWVRGGVLCPISKGRRMAEAPYTPQQVSEVARLILFPPSSSNTGGRQALCWLLCHLPDFRTPRPARCLLVNAGGCIHLSICSNYTRSQTPHWGAPLRPVSAGIADATGATGNTARSLLGGCSQEAYSGGGAAGDPAGREQTAWWVTVSWGGPCPHGPLISHPCPPVLTSFVSSHVFCSILLRAAFTSS